MVGSEKWVVLKGVIEMMETILKNTAFFAIFVIAGLAVYVCHKFLYIPPVSVVDAAIGVTAGVEQINAAKEIATLAITSIGSLATGGALGFMAGRVTRGTTEK